MEMKKVGQLKVLPPAPGKCQTCAVEHDPAMPHDKTSLYYQMLFCNDPINNGRSATWEDAMAHCTDEVKEKWRASLLAHGEKLT